MTPKETIIAIQKLLGVTADGIFGPKSKAALEALIYPPATPIPNPSQTPAGEAVDARSEGNIKTLHPRLQPLARRLIQQAKENGMTFKITSGSRTFEEQFELRRKYEAGGPKAARPGFSNHNFQLAFDVTEFGPNGIPIWESPNYKRIGSLAKGLGLFWGGTWSGNDQDEPHIELRPSWAKDWSEGAMIAELRRRHDNGIDPFA